MKTPNTKDILKQKVRTEKKSVISIILIPSIFALLASATSIMSLTALWK